MGEPPDTQHGDERAASVPPAHGAAQASVDPLQLRIGQRIRRRREELGMTQQELAGTELTRGFISQLEKGIVMPSLKSLELIAARLYKPVSYFLEEPQEPAAPEEALQWLDLARVRLLYGQVDEARTLVERARATCGPHPESPSLRGRLALVEGLLARAERADPQTASGLLREAVQCLRQADEAQEAARASVLWAEALLDGEQPAQAAAVLEELLRTFSARKPGEFLLELHARALLGLALQRSGRFEEALPVLQEALERCRAAGWWLRPDELLLALALAHRQCGHPGEAEAWLGRACSMAAALNRPRVEGDALRALAELVAARSVAEAAQLLERATEAYRRAGAFEAALRARADLADLLARAGEESRALAVARAALTEAAGPERVRLLLVVGQLLAKLGREDEALEALQEAVRLAEADGTPRHQAAACSQLGHLLRRRGQHEAAGEYLARALALYEASETR